MKAGGVVKTRQTQQINGREAKTATFLKRRLFSLTLSVAGFCPRHLNRWAFRGKTKRFVMAGKLKTIFVLTFTLLLFSVSALACTCSYSDIKAKGFSGQIFAISPDKPLPDFNSPLPKATVKLLKRTDDGDKVVAEVVADENGRFSLENVKSGKYFLQAEFPNFSYVFVQIKISGSSHRKKDKIVVALAPGLTCCEGYAKVQKST